MKKTLPALLAALALTLTGCASMLERDYASASKHVEYPVSEDSSILQAESYQGLVSALLYFVSEHAPTGVVHLSNYLGDVRADLDAACAEVAEQDPLGAYALNAITHDHTRIVSYYEVTFSFDYAHTAEEVAAIVPAAGSQAVFQAVSAALARFDGGCVLRLSYFTGDEAALLSQTRQAWLNTPLAALAQPEVGIKLYPDSGTSRVAEFTFIWPGDTEVLAAQAAQVEAAALTLLQELDTPPEELTAHGLLNALDGRMESDPEGDATAYAALVEGRANGLGKMLALRLLCQLADLEATAVEGRLNGESRFWLIVSTPEGYRHLDPSAEEQSYATDKAFAALGYEWSADRYPDCTDYEAVSAQAEEESLET